MINSANIGSFQDCKIIDGDITISNESFIDMHPTNLNVLRSVTHITGFLEINAWHEDFINLSYLNKLEAIGENLASEYSFTLYIEDTSLKSLELRSLKHIVGRFGVVIVNNKDLCYVGDIKWSKIVSNPFSSVQGNADLDHCRKDDFVCDQSCNDDGCWGAGPKQCLQCKENKLATRCLLSCDTISCENFYKSGCYGKRPVRCACNGKIYSSQCQNIQELEYCEHECIIQQYIINEQCHSECNGCSGPGANECTSCKNLKDGQNCVAKCTEGKYPNNDDECRLCNEQCFNGCTGPGPHQCTTCKNFKDGQKCVAKCSESKYFNNAGECRLCNEQCINGCKGPGSHECTSCKNFEDGQNCVAKCTEGKYPNNDDECRLCNEQCFNGCTGPGPHQCTSCKNFKDGQKCVAKCSESKYFNNAGECRLCNEQCISGCTGPGSHECTSCKNSEDGQNCVAKCTEGKYPNNDGECILCNEQCFNGCTGPGPHQCTSCKNLKDDQNCVANCTVGKYHAICKICDSYRSEEHCVPTCPIPKECHLCHEACIGGCTGPESIYGPGGCNFCNKIILISNDIIKCLQLQDPCPNDYIEDNVTPENEKLTAINTTSVCIPRQNLNIFKRVGIISIIPVIIILASIGLWILHHKEIITIFRKTDQTDIAAVVTFEVGEESNLLSQLPTIEESEIYKTKLIGQGAFGTVHEAVWKSDCSNKEVKVAVKVLHENSNVRSIKELLDEAVILASLDHPNIVHLIAICVTTEIMLITKLMPLGCILNYVRLHSNMRDIAPKTLLNWGAQITTGMVYLEENHLVHRDLAARNVLLETEDCIKIADFGLSKFASTLQSGDTDTKFPTKWLAPECLEARLFTHKSDVWAFAVTIWEILTFGKRPYDETSGRELLKRLKGGLRLPQPPNCNADVYAILIRCWLLKPEFRPDFAELERIFGEMYDEPSKYLIGNERKSFTNQNDTSMILKTSVMIEKTNSIKSTNSFRCVPTHSNYQGKSLYFKNQTKLKQETETIELNHLPTSKAVYYEHEGYLEPTVHASNSDFGYDSVINLPRN